MRLRRLEKKDAVYMLEWMKEPDAVRIFRNNFTEMTIQQCEKFIQNSKTDCIDDGEVDLAVTDENDEYMGTISLKNIDMRAGSAEYAISMRKCARGTGIALEATNELLDLAFVKWKFNRVYLNVLEHNVRAIKFYEKVGFVYEGTFRKHLRINGELVNLRWYSILKDEYEGKEASNEKNN